MNKTGTIGKKIGRRAKDAKVPLNTRIREATMQRLVRFCGQGRIQCEVVDQAILAYTSKGEKTT